MPTPALTLQAIAEEAGVSKMSVSRALANKPGVSAALKEKIQRIAKEHGYRPNPLTSALMSNLRAYRSHRATDRGTVLAFLERADYPGDARTEHLAGARQAAEEQGYKLEAFVVGKVGLTAARLNNILMARNIPGVVIAPLPESHGQFALEWSRFCTVAIEYTFSAPVFDRVVHDSYASMRLIIAKSLERGFRRIGLMFTNNGIERTEGLNVAAYWMEQKKSRAFSPLPPLVFDKWKEQETTRWLTRYRPEVIVTSLSFIDQIATLLHRRRVKVPGDISLLNVNLCNVKSEPPDTITGGIDQNNRLIGATSVRLLIDKINRNDRGIPEFPSTILTPGIWRPGTTFAK